MHFNSFRALIVAASFSASAANAQQSVAAADAVLEREIPHLASQIHLSLAQETYPGKPDGFRIIHL